MEEAGGDREEKIMRVAVMAARFMLTKGYCYEGPAFFDDIERLENRLEVSRDESDGCDSRYGSKETTPSPEQVIKAYYYYREYSDLTTTSDERCCNRADGGNTRADIKDLCGGSSTSVNNKLGTQEGREREGENGGSTSTSTHKGSTIFHNTCHCDACCPTPQQAEDNEAVD